MKKLFGIFSNIFVQSFVYTALVCALILYNTERYKLKRIAKNYTANQLVYEEDLDKDGNSEHIIYYIAYPNRLSIVVNSKGKVIDQWNFKGSITPNFKPYFCDYDNDGVKDIILFTQNKDKVYLHILDAINRKVKLENKFITKVYKGIGDNYNYAISSSFALDANKDGYKEMYFLFTSGYAARPRRIFAYFPQKDTIIASPESYSHINNPKIMDLDKDGIPEIFVNSFAYGNTDFDKVYTDMFSWLMVFTPDLKFKFKPKRFDKYPSMTHITPFRTKTNRYIMVYHDYRGTDSIADFLALYDAQGNEVRRKTISNKNVKMIVRLFAADKSIRKIYAFTGMGETIMEVDSLLNLKFVTKLESIRLNYNEKTINIDHKGTKKWFLYTTNEKELIVTNNNFTNPLKIELDEARTKIYCISIKKEVGKKNIIRIDNGVNNYLYSYDLSTVHKYWFLLFSALYVVSLGFLFIIKKLLSYKHLKIDTQQRRISELQMQSIQNQIDPHFTFNILTSFGKLINDTDKEKAHFLFKKYSEMLKQNFSASEKVDVSLKEELEFVKTYLDLEQFRYGQKFIYEINISQNINLNLKIPRMLLHIFVENAVKHGLRHLDKNGKLWIEIKNQNRHLLIKITDNGIGREKAKQYSKYSTGKGLNLIKQIIDEYNKLFNVKISFTITDLNKSGTPAGTEVNIKIPV